jgi:hypothetical protein
MEKLCIIGNLWWNKVRGKYDKEIYKNYVSHIKTCKFCQRGLGMTKHNIELINEFTE